MLTAKSVSIGTLILNEFMFEDHATITASRKFQITGRKLVYCEEVKALGGIVCFVCIASAAIGVALSPVEICVASAQACEAVNMF